MDLSNKCGRWCSSCLIFAFLVNLTNSLTIIWPQVDVLLVQFAHIPPILYKCLQILEIPSIDLNFHFLNSRFLPSLSIVTDSSFYGNIPTLTSIIPLVSAAGQIEKLLRLLFSKNFHVMLHLNCILMFTGIFLSESS